MQADVPRARPGLRCPRWLYPANDEHGMPHPKAGQPMDTSECCHQCAFWMPVPMFNPETAEVQQYWDCATRQTVIVGVDLVKEKRAHYQMLESTRKHTIARQDILLELVAGDRAEQVRQRVKDDTAERKMISVNGEAKCE